MSYKKIDIPGNGTRWEGAPKITIETKEDTASSLVIKYISQGVKERDLSEVYGVIKFRGINYLSWKWFGLMTSLFNKNDFEFRLIEIFDSELLEFLEKQSNQDKDFWNKTTNNSTEPRFRHFRIGFDDHGTYDIISAHEPEITTEVVPR